MSIEATYLENSIKLFLYYKTLGEKAMEQLQPEQLFHTANENSNAISVIVQHLAGNMLSRWTDFLQSDGEKDWRNRDTEFEPFINDKEVLITYWNKGWNCLFTTLGDLQSNDLIRIVYIRNERHTVLDAINRQLAHYAYHVGQIVFYAKLIKESPWSSLSIPKKGSASYNAAKFDKKKDIKNFTDDELNKL